MPFCCISHGCLSPYCHSANVMVHNDIVQEYNSISNLLEPYICQIKFLSIDIWLFSTSPCVKCIHFTLYTEWNYFQIRKSIFCLLIFSYEGKLHRKVLTLGNTSRLLSCDIFSMLWRVFVIYTACLTLIWSKSWR